ncbi:MAG: pyridoxal phosphate-dependent aminotransferase [Bifidobacteriaceae bacterium]|jgi:aspartate aminotransferase|nr:pyridoxal phosphate-dependent aminotransferase [Bifidobacteriaceae bacterium]
MSENTTSNKTVSNTISKRIMRLSPSTTLEINARARKLAANGARIISLAAGEPDFGPPQEVLDFIKQKMDDPANHKYTFAKGMLELRKTIAKKTTDETGVEFDDKQVIITNGAKQAIFEAFETIINYGDEVLLPAPYWTTYPELIQLAEGIPVVINGSIDNNFKITVDQLEAEVTDKTKALVLVTPNNPTGSIYTSEELAEICQFVIRHNLILISDEIYNRLDYTSMEAVAASPLKSCPEVKDNILIINGLSKSFAMTGWRIGWIIGPQNITNRIADLQSHVTGNVNNFAQYGAIKALEIDDSYFMNMKETLYSRRDIMFDKLSSINYHDKPAFLNIQKPAGAFYYFANIENLLEVPLGEGQHTSYTDSELVRRILDETGVALVPGSAFGYPGYIRFSFALDTSDLIEALDLLKKYIEQ